MEGIRESRIASNSDRASIAATCHAVVPRLRDQGRSAINSLRLLNHFLELSPEHSSVVAIKRDMEPIPFLALDDELCRVAEIWCARSVFPRLRDHVDHQVPSSRLTYLCQRASDRLLCFVRGCETRHRCGGCSGQPGNIGSGQRGTMPGAVFVVS